MNLLSYIEYLQMYSSYQYDVKFLFVPYTG